MANNAIQGTFQGFSLYLTRIQVEQRGGAPLRMPPLRRK